MDLARINSPTRLRTLSIFSASTRRTLSEPLAVTAVACSSVAELDATSAAGVGTAVLGVFGSAAIEAGAAVEDLACSRTTRALCAIVGIRHLARICSADLSE